MSWRDRLKTAAYTSPSGTRLTFAYENVSREVDKRTAAFSFPGVNDEYVQDNGHSSRRYPMRCFFSGADHDIEATRFEAALLETGRGRLEHPLYGTFDVVPFGTISRRDDLKTAANQSVIEVTFWTTVRAVYPSASGRPSNEVQAAIDAFDLAAANQFEGATDLAGALNQARAKSTIRDFLLSVSDALNDVSNASLSVTREFRDLQSTVNLGLDVLIGQPLQIAQQISNLIKAPGRALSGILDRLNAYGDLAESIFGSKAGSPDDTLATGTALALLTTRAANDFHISDLFASNAVGGSVVAALNHQFTTRPEAISAADTIIAQFDALTAWRDAGFGALEVVPSVGAFQVDTGESISELQSAVALAAGFLVEISFTLVPERIIVLDRPRTVIDLSAELYGTTTQHEFLITSNALTGDEILELPRGKQIRYYV